MWQLGDECNYFSLVDEEEGTKWQRRALIEARDEKTRVIEQLIKTISEMKSNLENKETVDDDNDDEIVRKFEEFYVYVFWIVGLFLISCWSFTVCFPFLCFGGSAYKSLFCGLSKTCKTPNFRLFILWLTIT